MAARTTGAFYSFLLVLSLVPSKFSKTNCMEFFGCSKWMIEQAQKIKSESGPGVIAAKEAFT